MSAKFLKGIFLIFGFCFFVQILWMVGVNFGMADPFCVVVGKKPLKCSDEGEIRVVAKQFCLGQDKFGKKKKAKKAQTPPFEQAQANNAYAQQYAAQQQYGAVPQGYLTQDQLRFLQQQQTLQAQRQQKASAVPDKKEEAEDGDEEE